MSATRISAEVFVEEGSTIEVEKGQYADARKPYFVITIGPRPHCLTIFIDAADLPRLVKALNGPHSEEQ